MAQTVKRLSTMWETWVRSLGLEVHGSHIAEACPGGSDGKASVYNAGDLGSIPGSGRSPGEGNGYPLRFLA